METKLEVAHHHGKPRSNFPENKKRSYWPTALTGCRSLSFAIDCPATEPCIVGPSGTEIGRYLVGVEKVSFQARRGLAQELLLYRRVLHCTVSFFFLTAIKARYCAARVRRIPGKPHLEKPNCASSGMWDGSARRLPS